MAEDNTLKKQYDDVLKNLKAPAQRVDLGENQHHYFPLSLQDGANQGHPFMRFRVQEISNRNHGVTIFLYQPPGVAVGDGANYGSFDMGTLKGGMEFAKKALGGTAGVTKEDLFASALIAKNKIGGGTALNIRSKAALKSGIATNPYTRQSFEGVNIRTYSFSFKLVAESKKESEMARNIERTFRKFLYPKRSGSVALTYPPLFDIKFYSENQENEYMPVIKPCYLTSMETTFNETANTMFKGTGAPIEVGLSLSFQEERALVRQDLYAADKDIDERKNDYEGGAYASSNYYQPGDE